MKRTSYATILPLSPRPRDSRTNNARQLLTSHPIEHAHGAHHKRRHEHPKARKQEKRHTDIFPLARRPTPLHGLDVLAIAVLTHDGGAASTLMAGAGFGVAGAAAAAIVGVGCAVLVVGEAGWEEGAEGWQGAKGSIVGIIGG